ncbi:MAG: hypothetical protein HY716_13330 [Planctomycetes bacterium]|nr:hypothetical protein [Planctomycetota bacterium]
MRTQFSLDAADAAWEGLSSENEKARSMALESLQVLTGAPANTAKTWWEQNRADAQEILKRQRTQFNFQVRRSRWPHHNLPADLEDADVKERTLKFLKHPDPRVKRDAAWMAREANCTEAVPHLKELLAEEIAAELKVGLLHAFTTLDPKGAVSHLVRFLKDPAAEVRSISVSLLPGTEWECATSLLQDPEPNVRQEAIRTLYRAGQATPLRERFPGEMHRETQGVVAVALVLLESDPEAAKTLIDYFIDEKSGIRLDALYSLNRMSEPATFDRLVRANYPEIDLNARWSETIQAVEEGAQVNVILQSPNDRLKRLQGYRGWGGRLTPNILERFRRYLEDPTDDPGWTFLLKKETLIVLSIPEAIEHWKQWRRSLAK